MHDRRILYFDSLSCIVSHLPLTGGLGPVYGPGLGEASLLLDSRDPHGACGDAPIPGCRNPHPGFEETVLETQSAGSMDIANLALCVVYGSSDLPPPLSCLFFRVRKRA